MILVLENETMLLHCIKIKFCMNILCAMNLMINILQYLINLSNMYDESINGGQNNTNFSNIYLFKNRILKLEG